MTTFEVEFEFWGKEEVTRTIVHKVFGGVTACFVQFCYAYVLCALCRINITEINIINLAKHRP